VPSRPDGAPKEEVLRSAIVASIEEGEVPQAIRGAPMIPSCVDGNVKNLTIRAVGRQQKRLGKTLAGKSPRDWIMHAGIQLRP